MAKIMTETRVGFELYRQHTLQASRLHEATSHRTPYSTTMKKQAGNIQVGAEAKEIK